MVMIGIHILQQRIAVSLLHFDFEISIARAHDQLMQLVRDAKPGRRGARANLGRPPAGHGVAAADGLEFTRSEHACAHGTFSVWR